MRPGHGSACRSCAADGPTCTRPHNAAPRLPLLRQLRARAATPRPSSVRPITCCRSRSQTGKLEIRSNAVVARILVDDKGRANGVQYFDRVTGAGAPGARQGRGPRRELRGLDANPAELDVRKHPNGIGNGSDVIGRYLCEQIRLNAARVHARRSTATGSHQRPRHRRRARLPAAVQPSSGRTRATICAASACSSGARAVSATAPAAMRGRSPASAPT